MSVKNPVQRFLQQYIVYSYMIPYCENISKNKFLKKILIHILKYSNTFYKATVKGNEALPKISGNTYYF